MFHSESMEERMHSLLLVTAILAGSGTAEPTATYDSMTVAASELSPRLTPGTLMFSEGDCLAVRIYTHSNITHVGTVVHEGDEVFVYDSTAGVGVRKLPIADYLGSQAPNVLHVHQPLQPLSQQQAQQLAEYLASQIGRPYAIQHHLTGERCEGLHCAEYATDALMAIDVMKANRPAKVSPASLQEGITRYKVYSPGEVVQLVRPSPPSAVGDNACHQLWIDTCECCSSCCDKLRGWFLCQ
ncbi:MAG: YiiX/YebB-like N1pC/P60 family cysteine hydrolase [Planctomycetaceae bacterium]